MRHHRTLLHRASSIVAWATVGTLTACDPNLPSCLLTNSCCTGSGCIPRTNDARFKLDHLAGYLTLERGDETASGAAVLGQAGTQGSGRLAVAVRARSVSRRVPVVGDRSIRTDGMAEGGDFPVRESQAVVLAVDASFGLLNGFRAGDSRILGVDLLVGATALPAYPTTDLSPDNGARVSMAYGARLGVLSETRTTPGVSFTWKRRSVAPLTLITGPLEGANGGEVSLNIDDLDLQVISRRLTVGKAFGRLGTTAGIGEDAYRAEGSLWGTVRVDGVTQSITPDYLQTLSRRHAFLGVSYRLGAVVVGGEFGRLGAASGESTYRSFNNSVSGYTGGARNYLTLGARWGR